MKVRSGLAALALATTSTVVLVGTPPASAAVTTTTSGTTVTVTATGNVQVDFGCAGGQTTVNHVVALPPVGCGALTQVTVNGDGGAQSVYGTSLATSAFSAIPRLVAALGDGGDIVYETPANDQLDLGAGDDILFLFAGGATNANMELGSGTNDRLEVHGSNGADTITALSGSLNVSITIANASGTVNSVPKNAEYLTVRSHDGNDTIDTSAISAASTIDNITLDGGNGNDSLVDGPANATLYGGPGTNSMTGGGGVDAYWSEGVNDTLDGSYDALNEWVYDTNSLRSGGRTLTGFTEADIYLLQTHQGDITMRTRPQGASGLLVTGSLTRPGQQLVPAAFGTISLGQSYVGAVAHRGIADVVLGPMMTRVTMSNTGGGILDVTVPTGSWETTVTGSTVWVDGPAGNVNATNVTAHRVHGPWTNKNQGFAHRLTRDLLFRFPTDAARDQIRDQLTSGSKTRAQVTKALMDTDEYRGLDVDRVFVKYLRRTSDPSGRTFWINRLREGRALWRFRAQLFGSPEYFNKAGGTNAAYVATAYQDVLGRAPDPSGRDYWIGKLDRGADRGSVALQFINSPEARRRLVDDQFLRFLDRLPTSSEQSTWSSALRSDDGEQRLIAFLANSSAYYART